jgi:hypothetical protein
MNECHCGSRHALPSALRPQRLLQRTGPCAPVLPFSSFRRVLLFCFLRCMLAQVRVGQKAVEEAGLQLVAPEEAQLRGLLLRLLPRHV